MAARRNPQQRNHLARKRWKRKEMTLPVSPGRFRLFPITWHQYKDKTSTLMKAAGVAMTLPLRHR